MRMVFVAVAALSLFAPSFKVCAHDGVHQDHSAHGHPTARVQQEWGIAGDPGAINRTMTISMIDAMRFSPDSITVRVGETIRFRIANHGSSLHELVLGTSEKLGEHAEIMKHNPDMDHSDPHMAHVQPESSSDLVWLFNREGEFRFACLIPGHYEAGMTGTIHVIP